MRSTYIILVVVALVTTVFAACSETYPGAYEKISRLSPDNTVEALNLLEKGNHTDFLTLTRIDSSNLTMEEIAAVKCSIQTALLAHFNHQSFFMKMLGLITFYNIVTVLAVCTFAIFIILLCKDIAFFVAFYVGSFIIKLLFSGRILKFSGMVLSVLLLCFKEAPCTWTRIAFFFDEYTPLLGLFIFAGTSWYIETGILNTINGNKKKYTYRNGSYPVVKISEEDAMSYLMLLWLAVGITATIYHNHWMLGVVTSLVLFGRCGFFGKSVYGGYQVGFESSAGLVNCLITAVILVPGYIAIRINSPVLYETLKAFETGIMFWGSFIGLLSLLILSDWDYIRFHMKSNVGVLMWLQTVMLTSCIATMFFGTVLEIDCLKNIGGTYLVFWALDVQRLMFRVFKDISLTPIFFILFADLAVLRYWIVNYPEYFIFG